MARFALTLSSLYNIRRADVPYLSPPAGGPLTRRRPHLGE